MYFMSVNIAHDALFTYYLYFPIEYVESSFFMVFNYYQHLLYGTFAGVTKYEMLSSCILRCDEVRCSDGVLGTRWVQVLASEFVNIRSCPFK